MTRVRLALLAVVAIPAVAHATPSPDAVAKQVEHFYAKVTHLHADFREEITNATFGQTKTRGGTVWFARPGSMAWDFASPRDTSIVTIRLVSNGAISWHVDNDTSTVFVRNGAEPPSTPFLLVGSLTKDYTVALDVSGTYGTGTVLALTPRAKSNDVKRIELVVDPADGHVEEWIVIEPDDNVNRFIFDGVDTTTAPAASLFTVNLKAMPSYKIVKM